MTGKQKSPPQSADSSSSSKNLSGGGVGGEALRNVSRYEISIKFCGFFLLKNCSMHSSIPPPPEDAPDEDDEEDEEVDDEVWE